MFGFGLKAMIQNELAKLRGDLADSVKRGMAEIANGKVVKAAAYNYIDGVLAEGQAMSKAKLDDWFNQKRAELKTWAGQ